MKSDEQKVREVEEKLDGLLLPCDSDTELIKLPLGDEIYVPSKCDEWSGRMFQGYFTKRTYQVCNKHLRFHEEHADLYMEILS
jgi:hypothetical protein